MKNFSTLVFLLCLNTRDLLLLLLPRKQRNYHMLASLLIARGCQETDLKGGQKGEKEKIIIPGENAMNLSCLFAQERKKKGKMNRNNKRKRDLALSDVIKILMISDPCRKPRRDGKKQKIELSKRYKWNPGPRTSGLCVYFLLLGRAVCCVDALLFMLRL